MINKKRLLDSFTRMVSYDSTSKHEREVADYLKNRFTHLGCDVYEDDAGSQIDGNCGNVYVRCKGSISAEPLLFSAHMDTVEPGNNKKAVLSTDGIIRSDGTTILGADDIAGIAAVLEVLESLLEDGTKHRPIEVLLSVAEEAHLLGINQIEPERLAAKQAYVLDTSGPPGLAILEAPGHIKLEFTVTGKASHAGIEPERGISAIKIAAEAISSMSLGRVDSATTANVGEIHGGGETNVVAETCYFNAECRSLTRKGLIEQVKHMISCAEMAAANHGGRISINQRASYEPYQVEADSSVVRRFAAACTAVGITPAYSSTGGGSDNNVLNQHGIEGIVISCGMQNVHSVQEYIEFKHLVLLAELVNAIILNDD